MSKQPIVATSNLLSALLASSVIISCSSDAATPVGGPSAPACLVGAAPAADGSYSISCPNGSDYRWLAGSTTSNPNGCTARQLSGGVAITCSGKTVYLSDGEDGKDGTDGKDGKNGKNGKNGIDGKNGINGINGINGLNGKDGVDGKNGKDGLPGLNGKDGVPGLPGVDGKDGLPGLNGKDGVNGKDGANGVDGTNGTNGTNGIDGKDAPLPSAVPFFTETPEASTIATTAKFGFGATLDDSSFTCSVDGGPYLSCSSPVELADLGPGAHQFSVQASADRAPAADPAEFDWVVERPNILFVLADDLGYSDIHALGGEIDTPNLDALVANGRILTNHHVGTVSAITRSMLVSGTDHHLVGEGTMGPPTDERKGLPGYEGYLNDSSLSLAELLKDAGYHTYMAGKWHLGNAIVGATAPGKTPDQWGFERSYALLGGAGSNHFFHEPAGSKNYTRDGAYVQPGQPGQPGGYSTELYTNQLIEFIDSNHGDGKPFFAYAAYTSPHWPLAVPEPWLSKYKGKYDQGYDAIRAARIARLQSRGIIPYSLTPSRPAPETLTSSPASANNGTAAALYTSAVHDAADGFVDYRAGLINKGWSSLSDLEKKAQARYMEIYAGMVANLDYNVGRLIQHLQDIGEYDKTFILFHSDNGAEGWPISPGDPKATDEGNAAAGVYETLGGDNGQQNARSIHYGLRWAEVSATPFAQVKGQLGEGGVSTTAVAHLPGQVGQGPDIDWFSHVTDDTATFLAIAGVTPPTVAAPPNIDPSTGLDRNAGKVVYKNRFVYPVTGKSFLGALDQLNPSPIHSEPFGDEAYGRAYLFSADGLWKARWTEPPFGPTDGHWELFYVVNDRGETNDVSAQNPAVAALLYSQWQGYMTHVGGVEPLRPLGFY